MNWTLVLIGNLMMDTAIAIFAILLALEFKIIRYIDEKEKFIIPVRLKTKETKRLRKIAEFFSPITGNMSVIIFVLFISGIILQIIGIFS